MRVLTIDDFAGRTGSVYEVPVGGATVPLTLTEVVPEMSGPREGGSFRLLFTGPVDPVLGQAIYSFRSSDDEEADEIFIVPIARDANGTSYEAVFF
jgi:hypothetical protein